MKLKRLIPATAIVLSSLLTSLSASAFTVFDSVAEFSGTQGQDDWLYGYYATPGNASTFTPFGVFTVNAHPIVGSMWSETPSPPPWTFLWDDGAAPNGIDGEPEHWAVRRWVSDVVGPLKITGSYAPFDVASTSVSVWLDGTELFSASTGGYRSGYIDLVANISVGSYVDFAVSPDIYNYGNATTFKVSGTLMVPEPAESVMTLSALALFGASRRRKALK